MVGAAPTVRRFLADDLSKRQTKGTSDEWSETSPVEEQGTRMGEDMIAETGKEYDNVQGVSN
jgi:hypothetical protein